MEWYCIVLIVVGYLLMWIVSAVIIARTTSYDIDDSNIAGFFWPISLPIVLVKFFIVRLDGLVDDIEYKKKHQKKED